MTPKRYDAIFIGGGLSSLMLLMHLGTSAPRHIAIVEQHSIDDRPTVHWSYWSAESTFYDKYAIGTWGQARLGTDAPQKLEPYRLRLVRSSDVLANLRQLASDTQNPEWIHGKATAVYAQADGTYTVAVGNQELAADWVFDSAVGLVPEFPGLAPRALLCGTGLIVSNRQAVFRPDVATLFEPMHDSGFAYILPLDEHTALIESAYFLAQARRPDAATLLQYAARKFSNADLSVRHQEYGIIPLGFAPQRTTGPRHILLGTKRGLVKPSTGYGILRIEHESRHLARLWRAGKPMAAARRARQPYRLMDQTFLHMAAQDPASIAPLIQASMKHLGLADSLAMLDENLPRHKLARLLRYSYPAVSSYIKHSVAQQIADKRSGKVQ